MTAKTGSSVSSSPEPVKAAGAAEEMRSPLKPLLWLAIVLGALIAFGAYYN
ncbi:MAG: hypothetical protein ABW321_19675 [Polyangiales bacterium]